MTRSGRGRLAGLGAVLALLAFAPAAAAAPDVHAHRGGPYAFGVALHPENTLPAFAAAATEGFVLELDVKLTRDNVPLVIHDATLDRTTNCAGKVRARTAADIAANCRADVLGAPGSGLPVTQVANPTVRVPTLAEVMELARQTGSRVNVEIKNQPTDPDFDLTNAFATRVMQGLRASGVPRSNVIVQSFWPLNLEVAKHRWPGVETSALTQAPTEVLGPPVSFALRYRWVSPAWPTALPNYVALAHLLGLKVVPYTLDRPDQVAAADAAGVDAVISNDPHMARAALN